MAQHLGKLQNGQYPMSGFPSAIPDKVSSDPAVRRLVMSYFGAQQAPINDFFVKNGKIREDGRMVHEMYLYEVKKPSESTRQWDYYKLVASIPADQAFVPLSESKCPLVKKTQ